MTPRLYPLGIQTFEEIRENDMLYIDKTEYIYRMTHVSGRYVFLSRLEKAREIDPFGYAGFDPSGKIRLTL